MLDATVYPNNPTGLQSRHLYISDFRVCRFFLEGFCDSFKMNKDIERKSIGSREDQMKILT